MDSTQILESDMPDRSWIERDLRTRFPALAEQATRIYDEYERAVESGELGAEALAWLHTCSQARSSRLRDRAASIVGSLCQRFASAEELLLSLVREGRPAVAVSALGALHTVVNEAIRLEAVRSGLGHTSGEVRVLAACKSQSFGLRALLEQLAGVLAEETDAAHQAALRFSYQLLRDGYLLEPAGDGFVSVTVAGARGVVGQRFAETELSEKGVSQVIADLRAHAKQMGV